MSFRGGGGRREGGTMKIGKSAKWIEAGSVSPKPRQEDLG